ncbi:hypothetical protein, conserved [Eimeria praecox]|uniref:Uncharacterized protein n=1 Tax=Eimeria praecox TaxID=51316 RepID=U6H6Y6_9EIME|nr:hypothetical protein, conserved [Eimeria praecox]
MRIGPIAGATGFLALSPKTPTPWRHMSFTREECLGLPLKMSSQEPSEGSNAFGRPPSIGLEPFCFRQFDDPKYPGTRIPLDKIGFMKELHEILRQKPHPLVDGYAPFCKHIFIENFTEAKVSTLPITEENILHIRTGYLARRPEELPVLSRWLPASLVQDQLVRAKYLDLILYSREQIAKENAAMTKSVEAVDTSQPEWFIVAIKAQDEPFELPMNPITIMRNALIEEGGSGVSINRQAYARSVEYWSKHVVVQEDSEC